MKQAFILVFEVAEFFTVDFEKSNWPSMFFPKWIHKKTFYFVNAKHGKCYLQLEISTADVLVNTLKKKAADLKPQFFFNDEWCHTCIAPMFLPA